MIILGYFFLFLHKNICCGYSLEAPRQGASNEYPQHMFSWRNGENYLRIITKYSSLTSPLVLCYIYMYVSMNIHANSVLWYIPSSSLCPSL